MAKIEVSLSKKGYDEVVVEFRGDPDKRVVITNEGMIYVYDDAIFEDSIKKVKAFKHLLKT